VVRKAGDERGEKRGVKNRVRRGSEDFKETSKDEEEAMDTSSSMQPCFYRSIFCFHRIRFSVEQITYKWLNSFIRLLNIGSQGS